MKITLIGTGNLAWHIAHASHNAGHCVVQIYGRNAADAARLAQNVSAEAVSDYENLSPNTDIVLLAVSDNAISELAQNSILAEKISGKLVIHTAGSVPMSVLETLSANIGVLYPLQTITKLSDTDFSEIPICIEADTAENVATIQTFAKSLSRNVQILSSEQRLHVHLAAVMAGNFSNFMYDAAFQTLKNQNLSFDILKPLLTETLRKAFALTPKRAQTGPARRGDTSTLEKHVNLLREFPNMQDLYNFVSRKIWQNYQPDMDNFKEKLKDIKAFAFDVDGVFSDLITLDTQGELLRSMNVKDGYAVAEAVKAGLKIAIITGGDSQSVRIRFNRLGVPDVYLASKSKLTDLNDFCTKQNIALSEVLYMGDDVPDYECMKHVGLATCPADACPEIIGVSHYISDKRGSEGCVRDVIEQVMRVQGTWFKPF